MLSPRSRKSSLLASLCLVVGCRSTVQRYQPPSAPVTEISHNDYQALLSKYVGDDGKVAYGKWKDSAQDVTSLDQYLVQVTNFTPDTHSQLFKTNVDSLSFWINLYNAIVLREVIRSWPLASVNDIRPSATSFIKQGKGFFYDLKFMIGGQTMNLLDIENKIIRERFHDARIHFGINCGSASCPLLRKEAFDSARLESQLETASRAFVNDIRNVDVRDSSQEVWLSEIFKMYKDDFGSFAKQKGRDSGLLDFLLLYAQGPLVGKLTSAKANGYKLRFQQYDWSVNNQDDKDEALLQER